MLTIVEVILVLTVLLILAGAWLVRSGRPAQGPTQDSPAGRCRDPKCRHRNPGGAVFCARCGQRIKPEFRDG